MFWEVAVGIILAAAFKARSYPKVLPRVPIETIWHDRATRTPWRDARATRFLRPDLGAPPGVSWPGTDPRR